MEILSKLIDFIASTWLTLLRFPPSSYQEFLLIFNTYSRWYLVCCYGWLCILNILSPKILFSFIKATSNIQPRSWGWWIKFIVTSKRKGDTTKETIVDCCYQDMVLPMYDDSYDEGLQEDDYWWKLWAGASSINIYQY